MLKLSDQPIRRVLLKVSGEGLMGDLSYGIDPKALAIVARDIQQVAEQNIQICLVVGGGNIFRGVAGAAEGMDRAKGDYAGMLATVINALMLQNALVQAGVDARVMSAISMTPIAEPYVRERALKHMSKGRIVVFAAGTGNPFFTTDTASALRAIEMECDVMMKATQVDGVYSDDPRKNPQAERYDQLTYTDILTKGLNVMDAAAISLARENKLPVIVFNMHHEKAFSRVMQGQGLFTRIVSDN